MFIPKCCSSNLRLQRKCRIVHSLALEAQKENLETKMMIIPRKTKLQLAFRKALVVVEARLLKDKCELHQ
jgi:hypothetical protein